MSADATLNFIIELLVDATTLVIIALGLAVIFGLIGVINFAHGDFLMLGAFVTLSGVRAGLPIIIAMILATLAVGALGVVVERLLIRRLYRRLEATILATFGLSLVLSQSAVLIWGTTITGVPTPLGHWQIGQYGGSVYQLVLIGMAVALVALVYCLFTRTNIGLTARAVSERPDTAESLGVNVGLVRMATFGFGSALAGASGALLSPIVAITPTLGATFVAPAFMTVVVGGPAVVSGTAASGGLLGGIQHSVAALTSPLVGTAALLVVAIVLLRVMPLGLSGQWKRAL